MLGKALSLISLWMVLISNSYCYGDQSLVVFQNGEVADANDINSNFEILKDLIQNHSNQTPENILYVSKSGTSFNSIEQALDSINDASDSNPYLIYVGPGTYIISEPIILKPHVTVKGSGQDVTRIIGNFISTDESTSTAVTLVSNSNILDVHVENQATGTDQTFASALFADGNNIKVRNVSASASGEFAACAVLGNTGSELKIFHSALMGSSSSFCQKKVENIGSCYFSLGSEMGALSTDCDNYLLTYGTLTSPVTGRMWMDRNVGAKRACENLDDSLCRGYFFQWGRPADGHQLENSETTKSISNSIAPTNGSFILLTEKVFDWTTSDPSGEERVNNWTPCPNGFRIPTQAEFEAEDIQSEEQGFYNLKLSRTGWRSPELAFTPGELVFFEHGYWLKEVNSFGAYPTSYFFRNDGLIVNGGPRAQGRPVRCIQE